MREAGKKEKEAEALQRKNGSRQTMHYLQSVPFESWMNHATLFSLRKEAVAVVRVKKSPLVSPVYTHSQPLFHNLCSSTPQVETSKIREEKGCAFIDFPVINVTAIYETYSNNTVELNKIIETITIKNDTNVTITHISIHATFHPTDPYRLNEKLARERTQSLCERVCKSIYAFDGAHIQTDYTPEDWEGFEALLCDTTFQEKEAIIKP